MYFNAQRVRKPGLRTTNHGRASTYPVSHNGGRVISAKCSYRECLILRVQSRKGKVKGEWALLCLTHNVPRLYAAMQY
jgi:hypothetical protein